jgi:hypothetical protein
MFRPCRLPWRCAIRLSGKRIKITALRVDAISFLKVFGLGLQFASNEPAFLKAVCLSVVQSAF